MADNYKMTELGLIPSDWEVKRIGDVFTFFSTSNYSKAEMSLEGEVGCVHYGLIHSIENTNYSLLGGIKYYVNREQAKYERLQEGDVVMVDASEDLVGLNKSVEVFNLGNVDYIAGLHTFHLRDKNSVYVPKLRGLVLNSAIVKSQMLKLAVGMKVFGVSKPQLQQVLIPIPTKAEQTAIATALSDADNYISSLEKLIAKKRLIKQGAMQQLLSPKADWTVKKLGEVAEIRKGQLITESQAINGDVPVIAGGIKPSYYHNKANRKSKTLTVSASGANAGFVAFHNTPIFASDCSTIEDGENYDVQFLFFLLQSKQGLIYKLQTGGAQPHIYPEQLKQLEISIPKNKEEQTRIATILSDMDAGIAALEKQLAKARSIKQGMMQQLLTGKIRLV